MLFSVVLFVFNACSNPYLAGTLVFKINYKSPGYFPGGGGCLIHALIVINVLEFYES